MALSWAVFLRFFHLGNQSYWMDEGYTVNATLSAIARGKTVLDSGQYYSCPTYCYPSSWLARIFGQTNPASFRALAVIAGSTFIIAIFLITKKWFGRKVAALSAFFIAFSYWQIAWSRQARWYTLLELFFWLAIYFFWQTISCKNNYKLLAFNIFMTILWTALALVTHAEAYLLLPIFLLWFTLSKLHTFNFSLFIRNLVFSTAVLAIFIFAIDNVFGLSYIIPLVENIKFHYSLPYYLNFYLRNYWFFVLFAIWAIFTRSKNNQSLLAYLLTSLLAYLLAFGLLTDLVHYRYLFIITPALYILSAYGMVTVSDRIMHKLWRVVYFFVIIFVFFISGHGVLGPNVFYSLESDNPSEIKGRPYYAYTPQSNFNEAYNYVKEKKSQEDLIISSHPAFNKIFLGEPGYWLSYHYLGVKDTPLYISPDNREYYVGAKVIQ
ncbi:MAG: glycosyltransferase family 39 protein, partial [bacterium]|nr:glycosyltransferase family 39 protein [bacterium]